MTEHQVSAAVNNTTSIPGFRNPRLTAEQRVGDLLAALTLEEKSSMMASRQPAILRLGLGEFQIGGEAAHGLVTKDGPATVFPQTQGLACTWDEDLLYMVGTAVADEARAYYNKKDRTGGLCLWAPTIDMERDPRWGRHEEAYGEDPILTAVLSGAYIRGMQGDDEFFLKSLPTPKHFYANNNEDRRSSCSASVDPRNRHEYYLKPFELVVKQAKVHSFMTSYNAINGWPAMTHPDLLNLVKGQWGMQGFLVCDGGAFTMLCDDHKYCPDYAHAAAYTIKAGVDNLSDDADKVTKAVREALDRGLLTEADLDRALQNVFMIRLRLGNLDSVENDPFSSINEAVILSVKHKEAALEAARKSIVLLKNSAVGGKKVLPIDVTGVQKVALLGPLAEGVYRDWYCGKSLYAVNPLTGLSAALSVEKILFADGLDLVRIEHKKGGIGTTSFFDGTLAVNRSLQQGGEMFRHQDWGWGNHTFRSLVNGCYLMVNEENKISATADEVFGWFIKSRFEMEKNHNDEFYLSTWNGQNVVLNEHNELSVLSEGVMSNILKCEDITAGEQFQMVKVQDGIEKACKIAKEAEVALVFVGNHPMLVAKEEIDRSDLSLPPSQIKLLEAVCEVNPRTVAVIISGYPYSLGDLAEKLAGIVYLSHAGQEAGHAIADVVTGTVSPSGRLPCTWYSSVSQLPDIMNYDIVKNKRTYRYFDKEVLFPFGYGLSYSEFKYISMDCDPVLEKNQSLKVSVRVKNSGNVAAAEVVQLYGVCRDSEWTMPDKQLLAFRRIEFLPGEEKCVGFDIPASDFRIWNPVTGAWFLEKCSWILFAGSHSSDEAVKSSVDINGEIIQPRSAEAFVKADSFLDYRNLKLVIGENSENAVCLEDPKEAGIFEAGKVDFGSNEYTAIKLRVSGDSNGTVEMFSDFPSANSFPVQPGLDREKWIDVRVPVTPCTGIRNFRLKITGKIRLSGFSFVQI